MSEPEGINIEQYLGLWAMHEPMLLELADHVRKMDLAAHVTAIRAGRSDQRDESQIGRYELREDGTAVIDMVGTMTKYGSSLSQLQYGTVGVRKAIRNAVKDDAVKTIALRIDSPGGNFSGTSDLADEVFAARQVKPVLAYIEDIGASAAYFVASQATRISANPSAFVGSIGTYGVVADYSGWAAREGVKVHVIRAGAFKGMGEPGTEVTPEQLAEMRRTVNEANSFFLSAVARGRGINGEELRELADGRVHIAGSAVKLGLIDSVQTFDQAIKSLRNTGKGRSSKSGLKQGTRTMSENPNQDAPPAPVAATLAELKSTFPASTAEWREQCLEQGLTMNQATSAWIKEQEHRLAESNRKLAEQQAKMASLEEQAQAKIKAVGNEPLQTGSASSPEGSGAAAQFEQLVKEKVTAGMSRHQAITAVAKADGKLYEAAEAELAASR